MADIVVLGGCIVDLISYVRRFPKPGETFIGTHFTKGCGGKGANQCVMAKKLGASVGMIAKLGGDSFGNEYLDNLQQMGINTEFVTFSEFSQTSTATICVTDEGDNSIVYVPGAVYDLTPDDIVKAEEMIKNAKVLLCTYECPVETLCTALTLARKYNVKTVVNAAPANGSTYEKLYPLIDIICVNKIEAAQATGLLVMSIEDSEAIIKEFHLKGCSTVMLTLGSKGAVFQGKDEPMYSHVSARIVKAVDTTGAGDAFMGSLVYFLAYHHNESLQRIVKKSCEIATLSVLKNGTQTSFPNREELPKSCFE